MGKNAKGCEADILDKVKRVVQGGRGLWHGLRTEKIGNNEYKNIVFRIRKISKDTPFDDL